MGNLMLTDDRNHISRDHDERMADCAQHYGSMYGCSCLVAMVYRWSLTVLVSFDDDWRAKSSPLSVYGDCVFLWYFIKISSCVWFVGLVYQTTTNWMYTLPGVHLEDDNCKSTSEEPSE